MYKLEADQQTINNLKIFLERITLTPKEIPAYVDIIKVLEKAEKIKDKKVGGNDGNA